MLEAKEYHGICAAGGLIYVLGGRSSDNKAFSSVHRFDPTANSWSTMAPMLSARDFCAPFVLNGSIYVAGGHDGSQLLALVERYDVNSNTCLSVGAMNHARAGFAVHAMIVEMNFFDSLILKAKAAQR
jgi:hypothetical protein